MVHGGPPRSAEELLADLVILLMRQRKTFEKINRPFPIRIEDIARGIKSSLLVNCYGSK